MLRKGTTPSREVIITVRKSEGNHNPRRGPVRRAMGQQAYETPGKNIAAEMAQRQPHELLLMLGGALAVLLSVVLFGIQWSQGIGDNQIAAATTTLVIGLVLGGTLWVSAAVTRKSLMNGAIVAGVVSIVLILYGGQPGTIGGLVGLLGAILAAASPYLPWTGKR